MRNIPDSRDYAPPTATWIDHAASIASDCCTMSGEYGQQEQRLLLAVLRATDEEKHVMQGDEKDVRRAHRMIDEAYMDIVRYAPHLIDAAKQQETTDAKP